MYVFTSPKTVQFGDLERHLNQPFLFLSNTSIDFYFPSPQTRAVSRRASAADNLWVPPLRTFVDRRAAADNLSARLRWHFCCLLIFMQFRIHDKKGHQKIVRIEWNFFGNLWEKCLATNAASRRRRFFGTCGAPSPLTKIDRRAAAADTMA